jgi:hypothetical protein
MSSITTGAQSDHHQAARERNSQERARLQGLREAAEESIRSQLAEYRANPPLRASTTSGGRLSPEAISGLSLTDEEIAGVEKIIGRVRSELRDDFMERVKLISSGPGDNGSRRYAYYARARPDRGKAFFDFLSAEFESTLGEERSRKFMEAFGEYEFIGVMGKLDTELNFTRKIDGGVVVSYKFRNPSSGSVSRFGESSLEEFTQKYGELFNSDFDE